MKILGIDPGLNVTGYGLIEFEISGLKLLEAGVIRPKIKDTLESKIDTIFTNLNDLVADFKPDNIVLENLYSHYRHPRTAITMGHARGVVLLSAATNRIPVSCYSATKIKKSLTGNGYASKYQIQRAVKQILKLEKVPTPADVADALAAAICHTNQI
jgi:crossover junction endodeoxyribonuclease RuvC